jgi:hypothetical protein
VIADHTCDPDTVAADLLAQAEHDTEARPILVCTEVSIAHKVNDFMQARMALLPTAETARYAVEKGFACVCPDIETAIKVSDIVGPEHLEIITADSVGVRYTYIYIYIYLYIYKLSSEIYLMNLFIYMNMFVRIYVSKYIYIYIYIYIHICIPSPRTLLGSGMDIHVYLSLKYMYFLYILKYVYICTKIYTLTSTYYAYILQQTMHQLWRHFHWSNLPPLTPYPFNPYPLISNPFINYAYYSKQCTSYGGIFIGAISAEVLGDYGAGPNHVLPTSGTARYTGGLR